MEDSLVEETCDLLSELIRNKCVNPPGNEMRSIRTIEKFLKEKGVKCRIFESSPDRGNLVANIKGYNENHPRLIFGPSHVDVVPVPNPEEWEVAPFSGEVKDGYIWGRGALDMLFIVASQVQAFARLHEEGFQGRGDLILLIVSDEETGGRYGAEWMLLNHGDLVGVDDSKCYAVTEAGGVSLMSGKIVFMIGEKGASWRRISFKGTPGHGSIPYGSDNALNKAAKAITLLTEYCDSKIPITTEYLSYLAEGLGMGGFNRFMLTNKFLFSFTLKKLKKSKPFMAKVVHGLSRMTISPNVAKGGSKVNIIAANAYVDLDIRTLPGQDEEYVITHLKKALGDLAEEAKVISSTSEGGVQSFGNASPASSDFVKAMERAVQKEMPNAKLVPMIMPGASDARYFRERNVDTYGFALFDPETPIEHLTGLAHGTNERISIKTVELSLKAYYNLANEFLGEDS